LSNADGPRHAARITVPFLCINNWDDDACTPSHANAMYEAVTHNNKEFHTIYGATHYYAGQRDKQKEACQILISFLQKRNLLESHIKSI